MTAGPSKLMDLVGGIGLRVAKIRVKGVDLGRPEPCQIHIEAFLDQELRQRCKLDCQPLPIPARALSDAVVGQHQRSLFRVIEAFNNDGGNRRHAEQSGGLKPSVPGYEQVEFVYENRARKAELANAGRDLDPTCFFEWVRMFLAFGRICSIGRFLYVYDMTRSLRRSTRIDAACQGTTRLRGGVAAVMRTQFARVDQWRPISGMPSFTVLLSTTCQKRMFI